MAAKAGDALRAVQRLAVDGEDHITGPQSGCPERGPVAPAGDGEAVQSQTTHAGPETRLGDQASRIDLGGGETPWDVLTSELDPRLVHLEVDLYWAYTGGVNSGAADPLAFTNDVIRSAPQEVRQYHVKDRHGADAELLYGQQPGDMADLGLGVIDFPAIFKKHQVEEYIVENDSPDFRPAATASAGFRYLQGLDF